MSQVWERLPEENEKAAHAFSNYLRLPHPRTFLDAYIATYRQPSTDRLPPRAAPTWFRAWPKAYQWEERARAYDAFMEASRSAGEAKGTEQAAIEWALERERLRERELDLGKRLCDQAMKLLDLPIDTEATLQPRDLAALATALAKGCELIRNAAEYPVVKELRLAGADGGEAKQTLTVIVQYVDSEPSGEDALAL